MMLESNEKPPLENATMKGPAVPKRARSKKSCVVCRQRKVKCDQQRPHCGGCLKKKRPERCVYEDSGWTIQVGEPLQTAKSSSITDRADLSGRVEAESIASASAKPYINIPYMEAPRTSDETNVELVDFNFGPFASAVRHLPNYGTLSWCSVMRRDLFLASTLVCGKKKPSMFHEAKEGSIVPEFEDKWKSQYPEPSKKPPLLKKVAELDQEAEVVAKLKEFLADTKLCWLLVEKFFDSELFVCLPFFEKTDFISRLTSIIGNSNVPPTESISSADLAMVGSLLIIMELTSIFVSKNFGKETSSITDPALRYIINHPVPRGYIPLIKRLHSEVINEVRPSIQGFQFLISKSYYDLYAPEECSCIEIADATKIGALLNYASLCFLNKDPSDISPFTFDDQYYQFKSINLRRRLWYGLVLLDREQFLSIGSPMVILEDLYDTKLPNDLASDSFMEKLANKHVIERWEYHEALKPLLKMTVLIKWTPTLTELRTEIQKLKIFLEGKKSLEQIIQLPCETIGQRLENWNYFKIFIDSHILLYMINFHLFHHFSHTHQKSLAIQSLLELINVARILYTTILFINPRVHPQYDPQRLFGSGILIFPKIEAALHRITLMFTSILARIKALKLFGSEKIHLSLWEIHDKTVEVIYNIMNHTLLAYVRVSSLYYHTWVISKIHAMLLKKYLTIPPGVIASNEKANWELEYMIRVKDGQGYDSGFEDYNMVDVCRIFGDLLKIWDICDNDNSLTAQYNNSNVNENGKQLNDNNVNIGDNTPKENTINKVSEDNNNALWDFGMIFDNDRMWLEKMVDSSTSAGNFDYFGITDPIGTQIPYGNLTTDTLEVLKDMNVNIPYGCCSGEISANLPKNASTGSTRSTDLGTVGSLESTVLSTGLTPGTTPSNMGIGNSGIIDDRII